MNYIVLDLEWNQQMNSKKRVKTSINLTGEIIQFGAVRLKDDYTVGDTFKIMVAPQYYKKMNAKVSRITNITNDDLKKGIPFPQAFERFRRWCGEDVALITWGFEDIDILYRNMHLHKIDTSWIPKAYNLQIIFDRQISKENRQVSLTRAMEMISEPALNAHDALNDALNTARICLHLNMEKGISEYGLPGKIGKDEIQLVPADTPDKIYSSKRSALMDKELNSFFYPAFDEKVVCSDFVMQDSKRYIAIGKSESGKELFVRFNFRKWAADEYSVTRHIYEMDEKSKELYYQRKEKVRAAKEKYYNKMKRTG